MMKNFRKCTAALVTFSMFVGINIPTFAAEHNHQAMKTAKSSKSTCQSNDVSCAKTVTSAFAPNGELWRVWTLNKQMFFQTSHDNGKTFSDVKTVDIPPEKISARNENRPKIAFDAHNGVYLSWAMPREKKYTADIRFAYSADNGTTFTQPITVNNDNLLAGHSFNEMTVSEEGDINIVWLDGRLSHQLRKEGKKTNGSALFIAQANFRGEQSTFTNQQLANNTCVCCRIAIDTNNDGELAIFWRHIYGDNIREFALLTLAANGKPSKPVQVSKDHWQINGCPHQGGGISIDQTNNYHLVWFNLGDKGKGIFYAQSNVQGELITEPLSIGDLNAQSAHPHIMQTVKTVDIVWTQFNGIEHQLWHQQSLDNGQSFAKAQQLAQASSGSDRPFIVKKDGVNYVSWHRPKQGHWFQSL